MELMINPPKEGDESYELYKKETNAIHSDLEERAELLYHAFQEMEDVKCNKPMGAMYIFPTLEFDPEHYHKLYSRAKIQIYKLMMFIVLNYWKIQVFVVYLVMDLVKRKVLII